MKVSLVILTSLFVIALNAVLVNSLGLKSQFSELGYFSNVNKVLKIQNQEDGGIYILGSSIAGRLLPNFFSWQDKSVFNLGIDAGGSASGCELFLRTGSYAEVLIVESNGLDGPPSPTARLLYKAPDEIWFKVMSKFSWVSPQYRPTSVVYHQLKLWNDSKGGQQLIEKRDRSLSPVDEDYVRNLMARLENKADHVIFVNYPSELQINSKVELLISESVKKTPKFSYIDLAESFPPQKILYTDQVHMTTPSAMIVSEYLENHIRSGCHLKTN